MYYWLTNYNNTYKTFISYNFEVICKLSKNLQLKYLIINNINIYSDYSPLPNINNNAFRSYTFK
jgi:hypothetical protein